MKKKLIIDRSKWRTGIDSENKTGRGQTNLLNYSGFMCCLGFDCIQSGIPAKRILGESCPYYVDNPPSHLVNKKGDDNRFANKAMNINDNKDTTPQQKEKLITDHYTTIGVKVIFTGNYLKLKPPTP